ncbi:MULTISPECIES: methyltransferase family protein [Aromatoleum]|uniref:Isoprenylcysteine carboxylmethyltransferase family protein n=2 Tax=Aromatoleum TaxID=551759 RepID=A0ABX1NU66_9RHOO|nr:MULTISPECIES: isoprenylcysteine carboxylmethyltransferase family protein [Aromatoleum]MCK0508514.1 isoprenylcysteine carboxylmethyltransferase family protein [Aromatoleum anaerobium]NMG15341.1 isoprenylcysteine carboxylmethyltransferase family protein [Aromatoleum bremense]QTQ33163.1 Phospholipid methyltransferase family protein [Aromatoleum bremense]
MHSSKQPWWRGHRGEWFVVLQAILFALILFGPRTAPGLPPWPETAAVVTSVVGALLIAAGLTMSVAAALHLGSNLTPLPHPREHATLVITGLYRGVRHPIYCGVILMAVGWALFIHGWLTLIYAAGLLLFFDIKSRREERWLIERFPHYIEYQQRVRKLIPFIY